MDAPLAPLRPASSQPSESSGLSRRGLRPRKSLGQNFLVNRGALRKIVDAAGLTSADTVLEVGPGTGLLTRELLARAGRVIAIEKDERLAAALRQELSGHPGFTILAGDMLKTTPEALLAAGSASAPYKVVANLPYYAATAILRRLLEAAPRPRLLVLLLQREVARVLAAKPGEMGLLSVAVQLYAEPSIVGIVKPGSFYPPPKVESAIVRLAVRHCPAVVPEDEAAAFLDVVRAGFSARRKQLANSLCRALGLAREDVAASLRGAGIDPKRRAETLSLAEWGAAYRALRDSA